MPPFPTGAKLNAFRIRGFFLPRACLEKVFISPAEVPNPLSVSACDASLHSEAFYFYLKAPFPFLSSFFLVICGRESPKRCLFPRQRLLLQRKESCRRVGTQFRLRTPSTFLKIQLFFFMDWISRSFFSLLGKYPQPPPFAIYFPSISLVLDFFPF